MVPTEFRSLNGSRVKTNQYSVTRHEKQIHPLSDRLPGVFISVSFEHYLWWKFMVFDSRFLVWNRPNCSDKNRDSSIVDSFSDISVCYHWWNFYNFVDFGFNHLSNKQTFSQNWTWKSRLNRKKIARKNLDRKKSGKISTNQKSVWLFDFKNSSVNYFFRNNFIVFILPLVWISKSIFRLF